MASVTRIEGHDRFRDSSVVPAIAELFDEKRSLINPASDGVRADSQSRFGPEAVWYWAN